MYEENNGAYYGNNGGYAPDLSGAYAQISSGMTLGIVSCILDCFPIASVVGLILGFVGLGKVKSGINQYLSAGEPVPKKKIPAKILTMVGGIGGIVMTVFWLFYIIAIVGAVALTVNS